MPERSDDTRMSTNCTNDLVHWFVCRVKTIMAGTNIRKLKEKLMYCAAISEEGFPSMGKVILL